jgi:hypothetical protein
VAEQQEAKTVAHATRQAAPKTPPRPRLVKSFSEMEEVEDQTEKGRQERQRRREEDQSGFFPVLES